MYHVPRIPQINLFANINMCHGYLPPVIKKNIEERLIIKIRKNSKIIQE